MAPSKVLRLGIVLGMSAAVIGAGPAHAADPGFVDFPDTQMLACVNKAINESYGPEGTRLPDQAVELTELDRVKLMRCQEMGITSLEGLEQASQLRDAVLSGNGLTNIEPLLQLTTVTDLFLSDNAGLFADGLPDFSGMTALGYLNMSDTGATELGGLSGAAALESLLLNNNQVSDLGPLANLEHLGVLHFDNNNVSDITPVRDLPSLSWLQGDDNHIVDISGISGDYVGFLQIFNQTRALKPVRVGDSYPNPIVDFDGNVVPLWLDPLAALEPGTPPATTPPELPGLPEYTQPPALSATADTAGPDAVEPSADHATWSYTETGNHVVRWHQYPCEQLGYCYFGGTLTQTAFDHGISDDQTVPEGSDATFEGWMDFPGETPSQQWQVSRDGGATWEDVDGATGLVLTLTDAELSQSGNLFRVVWTVPGQPEPFIGDPAELTVTPATTKPPTGGGNTGGTPGGSGGAGEPGGPAGSGTPGGSGSLATTGANLTVMVAMTGALLLSGAALLGQRSLRRHRN